MMNNYVIQRQLGRGSHGRVWLATCRKTGEKVAVKVVNDKFSSWDSCARLGEFQVYRDIFKTRNLGHPNVVRVREALLVNSELHFVIDYMPQNLRKVIESRDEHFTDSQVRMVTRQILQGLQFINDQGFFHRDIKPENILCDGLDSIKIGDFGEARKIDGCYPYTANIATRWYRAPELLLCTDNYSWPVDIWAVGCIMAELYALSPLFPGRTEIEQISLISTFLGSPSREDWEEGWRLAHSKNLTWTACKRKDIRAVFPGASREGLEILQSMLSWDPHRRPKASEALTFAAFQPVDLECQSERPKPIRRTHVDTNPSRHEKNSTEDPFFLTVRREVKSPLKQLIEAKLDIPRLHTADAALRKKSGKGNQTEKDHTDYLDLSGKACSRDDHHRERDRDKEKQDAASREVEVYLNILKAKIRENCEAVPEFFLDESDASNLRLQKSSQRSKKKNRRDVSTADRSKD